MLNFRLKIMAIAAVWPGHTGLRWGVSRVRLHLDNRHNLQIGMFVAAKLIPSMKVATGTCMNCGVRDTVHPWQRIEAPE